MGDLAINVRGLRKAYGPLEAVSGIDLAVEPGEVFAFLGPNGAGKTTTVEILEGYRKRSGGEVAVLGRDPGRADRAWRGRIGIVLQQSRMHPELTVAETLEMFAGYYPAARGVAETVDLVGLGEKADTRVMRLSGGQQRRLDVAAALIGDPELLFLDEPTTGFDPSARRQAWEMIAGLRSLGKTVFLTTHYIEEAQALADRVAVIRRGEIVATGTPADLGGRATAAARICFRVAGAALPELPLEPGEVRERNGASEVVLHTPELVRDLASLTAWALERGVELEGLEVGRPSLEDVYLELTDADPGQEER